jgi:internalin A
MFRTVAFALAVSGLCLSSSAQADDEDKAVSLVEKLGGKATRDEKAPGKPVVKVNLRGTQVTDAGLKELAALKNLTTLDLNLTQVTDAGLKELATLKNLTTLELVYTKVTDVGLKELRKTLPKCQIQR